MIRLLPSLFFIAFNLNSTPNTYTYSSRFRMNSSVCLLNTNMNGEESISINGYVWFEGDFYCYDTNIYKFHITEVGFVFNYYVNTDHSDTEKLNYSSFNSESVSIDITERDQLDFSFLVDYHTGLYNDNITLFIGSYDVQDSLNSTFYSDYINGYSLDGQYVVNDYFIDFSSDSISVDYFESTINTAISNVSPDTTLAYNQGFSDGESEGYNLGFEEGDRHGYDNGYSTGYNVGFTDGFQVDSTALTIFSGILAIGTLPINIFLAFFNFEVLGINFSELVSSMLSVCVCLIIIKKVFATDTGD